MLLAFENLIKSSVDEKLFPGCSVALYDNGKIHYFSVGRQTYDPSSPLVTEKTIYDIASITKSIPTTTLALQLIKEKQISESDTLDKFIDEVKHQPLAKLTIQNLLTLSPQFPFTLSMQKKASPAEIMQLIFNSSWSFPAEKDFPISNATAILLTLVIQRVTSQSLPELAAERIFWPLLMDRSTFYPETLSLNEIAPTEIQNWRGGLVRGQVHDESAWKLRELFISGSAGLFSCTQDLIKFVANKLQQSELIDLGWEFNRSWMGSKVSTKAFGKTGFTGCFILIDQLQNKGLVFLSNYIYPYRPQDRTRFNQFRNKLNDLVFEGYK